MLLCNLSSQLALLSSDKRAATVTAVSKVSVLSLTRDQFNRLLGPLKDMIATASSANQGA